MGTTLGRTVGTTLGRTKHTARSLVDWLCATNPVSERMTGMSWIGSMGS